MIDLHLHTIFSDGKITDIGQVVQNCDVIAITDHNSIQGCKYFADKMNGRRLIIGCEVTVDRAPDYLLYIPNIEYSEALEKEFEYIRLSEEAVIKKCYENLGYNQWDNDIGRAFSKNQKIRNARTRDLAAIIHLYKSGKTYDDGFFEFDDLKIARKQRWTYAEEVGNPVSEGIAFDIAKKHNGKLVLAHPIHTAIKRCSRNDTTKATIIVKLENLLKKFIEDGGKYLEWEYFSEEHFVKYELSLNDLEEIRSIIMKSAKDNELQFTIGTDSHTLKNYESALKWLKINEPMIQDRMADWIY